jgi:putative endonuclease
MKDWHLYLVRCCDGTLYCGISTNVKLRVAAHNAGCGARYTKTRRPVELVYTEYCGSISTALIRERKVKRLSKARKEELAKRGLMETSECRRRTCVVCVANHLQGENHEIR